MSQFISTCPKYVEADGILRPNPAYLNPAANGKPYPPNAHHQLAVISSMADMTGFSSIQLVPSALSAMQEMQSVEYQAYFENNDADLFQGLCDHLMQYEVPIGMLSKLLQLRHYRINIMIDDSGSMMSRTDVTFAESTKYIIGTNPALCMTRLQEAENRLHIMFDILSYIPTQGIQVSFMNTSRVLTFSQAGKSPEMFQQEVHSVLSEVFKSLCLGGTPTKKLLTRGLADAAAHPDHPTSHYLLTDGVPSDCSVNELIRIVNSRKDPERNPLTLISCTNVDSECAWMKTVEEKAAYCSEVDDYGDEEREVKHDQGEAFPYTKGLWILSNLVASISPDDLDALDEDVPFTKHTLDEMLGRIHSAAEYDYYWNLNPHAKKYASLKERFATEAVHARVIVPRKERKKDGCTVM